MRIPNSGIPHFTVGHFNQARFFYSLVSHDNQNVVYLSKEPAQHLKLILLTKHIKKLKKKLLATWVEAKSRY